MPLPVEPTTETRFTQRDDILGHTPVKLHEYQAKQLLARAGIPIPEGRLATTHEEAEAAARALGGTVVVKAQVHAGGRGKAGGIKVAKTPAEAREHASTILHMQIKGLRVRKVLVERGALDVYLAHAQSFYLHVKDRRRVLARLGRGLRDFDPAGLAASADVDLRFDDDRSAERARRGLGLLVGRRKTTLGDGDAGAREQLLGLVLVELHGV